MERDNGLRLFASFRDVGAGILRRFLDVKRLAIECRNYTFSVVLGIRVFVGPCDRDCEGLYICYFHIDLQKKNAHQQ